MKKGQLGRNIKMWRKAYSKTIEQVAKKAKMSKGSWSRIESGSDNITIKTLFKIAAALEMAFDIETAVAELLRECV